MLIRHYIFKRGKRGAEDARTYGSKWTLRLTWRDDQGKPKNKTRQFDTRLDAQDAIAELEKEIRATQGQSVVGDKMRFSDLASYAKRTIYKPAEIREGRKIAGIKSHRQTWILIDSLVEFLGEKKLAQITRSDMESFKSWRLKQGDLRGAQRSLKPKDRKPISLSTTNRALAIFKRLIKYAHAEGWISRDITRGSKAIDPDAEKAKTRTLNAREEALLLASCAGEQAITYRRKGKTITAKVTAENPHLKAIILLGLDAGLRRNEALTLEWQDINFHKDFIKVQSQHTKTQKSRTVGLSKRLKRELQALPTFAKKGRIFPFNDFKRSWHRALRTAGIEGLTFHDLRRTFVSRLSAKGVPLQIAGKLAGHSTLSTTQKHYVSTDDLAIIEDVWRKLEAPEDAQEEGGFVN